MVLNVFDFKGPRISNTSADKASCFFYYLQKIGDVKKRINKKFQKLNLPVVRDYVFFFFFYICYYYFFKCILFIFY